MAFEWTDKVNDRDYYNADDINSIAHEVISLGRGKVEKIEGKGLSENDFTDDDKLKLSQLPSKTQYQSDLASKASSDEIPKKLSELVDDTSSTDFAVNYALNSIFADHAMYSDTAHIADRASLDGRENVIHETYATKAELLEAIGEALEGDY